MFSFESKSPYIKINNTNGGAFQPYFNMFTDWLTSYSQVQSRLPACIEQLQEIAARAADSMDSTHKEFADQELVNKAKLAMKAANACKAI